MQGLSAKGGQRRLRRFGEQRSRGYFAADFADAFARYLPVPGPVTSVTPETIEAPQIEDDYPPSAFWTGEEEPPA